MAQSQLGTARNSAGKEKAEECSAAGQEEEQENDAKGPEEPSSKAHIQD